MWEWIGGTLPTTALILLIFCWLYFYVFIGMIHLWWQFYVLYFQLKYVLIWLKGIDVFYIFLKYCNRLSSTIFLLYGTCPNYSCFDVLMKWDLAFPMSFIRKSFHRLFECLWKFLISHYFSYVYMQWKTRKGLYNTSERSSTPVALWVPYLLGVLSGCDTMFFPNFIKTLNWYGECWENEYVNLLNWC